MTIFNEAVRLFFAVSALVLVGLLSTPTETARTAQAEAVPEMKTDQAKEVSTKTQIAERKPEKKLGRKAQSKKS